VTNDELSSTFRKKCFLFLQKVQKSAEKSKKYFTCISIKIGSISETIFTKMISTKSSTNPGSFIKFGRGRRIGWRLRVIGTSPIRLLPIGRSPLAKIRRYIGKTPPDFRQLVKLYRIYWRKLSGISSLAKVLIGENLIGEIRKPGQTQVNSRF
jgi:hypothetical protein